MQSFSDAFRFVGQWEKNGLKYDGYSHSIILCLYTEIDLHILPMQSKKIQAEN